MRECFGLGLNAVKYAIAGGRAIVISPDLVAGAVRDPVTP